MKLSKKRDAEELPTTALKELSHEQVQLISGGCTEKGATCHCTSAGSLVCTPAVICGR
jgi:hypothetical protein